MPQTPEDRIRRQYKALKRRGYWYRTGGLGDLRMRLARQWKRPVKEIRRIVDSL